MNKLKRLIVMKRLGFKTYHLFGDWYLVRRYSIGDRRHSVYYLEKVVDL